MAHPPESGHRMPYGLLAAFGAVLGIVLAGDRAPPFLQAMAFGLALTVALGIGFSFIAAKRRARQQLR